MTYETNPRNVLPNGLTLLQVGPDCAAHLDRAEKLKADIRLLELNIRMGLFD